jgi:hypothetical protein
MLSDNVIMVLSALLILSLVLIYFYEPNEECSTNGENKIEKYGALQSLHSNDGIQDAYLTIENDPSLYYDPYGYWRGVVWNLPTRNLGRMIYYPYLYEHQVDRYGMVYPYWSL